MPMTPEECDAILAAGKPADLHDSNMTEPYWCGNKTCISLGSSYMDCGQLVDERTTFNLESLRYVVALMEKFEADRAAAIKPTSGIKPLERPLPYGHFHVMFTQLGLKRIAEEGFFAAVVGAQVLATNASPYLGGDTQTQLMGHHVYKGTLHSEWEPDHARGCVQGSVRFSFIDTDPDCCSLPETDRFIGDIGVFSNDGQLLWLASGFQYSVTEGRSQVFRFLFEGHGTLLHPSAITSNAPRK